ncbi:MAG: hypothetical protein HY800_07655, partial [Ignavibacteriales bacterium]|nr:hypothetical protein [Ignavibacteriales bacterium]
MKLLMAPNGIIGRWVFYPNLHDPNFIGLEYPEGSSIEHLFCEGLWIGALIDTVIGGNHVTLKRVSTSEWASGVKEYPFGHVYEDYISEMTPFDTAHPWLHLSILNSDSGAVSESDYICEYTDTIPHKDSPGHMPLGVKVIQRSYAWGKYLIAPVLPIDYTIVNIGGKTLRDVYISLYFDPDVGTIYYSEYTNTNYSGYFPELRTVYIDNAVALDATPLGITILATPAPLQNDNYIFQWFSSAWPFIHGTTWFDEDSKRYDLMSGNTFPMETPIKPNQSIDDPGDVEILFSFGPIAQWNSNETLHVAYALVGGFSTKLGRISVYDNAKAAQTLYARNYHPFFTTPAPKLRIEPGYKSVTLNWAYTGSGVNPVETWDDANQLIHLYPEDHWRRINPPEVHTTGGRIFEGYRLYRSEDPAGTAKSFVMLRQWDMID